MSSLSNRMWLGELYYSIGKQRCSFKIAKGLMIDGKPVFRKWVFFLDATEEQISKATHRSILVNEIVLDFDLKKNETIDELKNRFNIALKELLVNNVKYKAYFTGSKGYHIHIFYDKLFSLSEPDRRKFRLNLINKYGCDVLKASEKTMIALETAKHWKTGKKMLEVKYCV